MLSFSRMYPLKVMDVLLCSYAKFNCKIFQIVDFVPLNERSKEHGTRRSPSSTLKIGAGKEETWMSFWKIFAHISSFKLEWNTIIRMWDSHSVIYLICLAQTPFCSFLRSKLGAGERVWVCKLVSVVAGTINLSNFRKGPRF